VAEALAGVHPLDLGHKKYVLVDAQELLTLGSDLVFAKNGFGSLAKTIDRLETLVHHELGSVG
jgi:hypothetical protein